jgi:hypothetical protein
MADGKEVTAVLPFVTQDAAWEAISEVLGMLPVSDPSPSIGPTASLRMIQIDPDQDIRGKAIHFKHDSDANNDPHPPGRVHKSGGPGSRGIDMHSLLHRMGLSEAYKRFVSDARTCTAEILSSTVRLLLFLIL